MTAKRDLLLGLLDDLQAESADLDARVADLSADQWRTATPAQGWDVKDTVAHLAATDRDALLAATDPDAFGGLVTRLLTEGAAYVDRLVHDARTSAPAQLLADWRTGRDTLQQVLRDRDPADRVVWFGPAMSPASFVTARIMETWAHGQDVVDALGQERPATARLRSVAEIGVRARPFSYAAHGRAVPEQPVRVELAGPGGEQWTWGPPDAAERVTGDALGFCLLVTQRRHRDDVDLQAHGPLADEWLGIAQAFAGPPGSGREPRA